MNIRLIQVLLHLIIPAHCTYPFYIIAIVNNGAPDVPSPQTYGVTTFDPFYSQLLHLRLIGPGYNILPTFILDEGKLSTKAEDHYFGQ